MIAAGVDAPSRRAEVRGDRVEIASQLLLRNRVDQAVAIRDPDRADVEAETLVDLIVVANGELRAAAS